MLHIQSNYLAIVEHSSKSFQDQNCTVLQHHATVKFMLEKNKPRQNNFLSIVIWVENKEWSLDYCSIELSRSTDIHAGIKRFYILALWTKQSKHKLSLKSANKHAS